MADLIAPLPVLPLTYGCTIVAEAIDPTTGDPVSGVAITAFTIYGLDSAGGTNSLIDLAPLLSPTDATVV